MIGYKTARIKQEWETCMHELLRCIVFDIDYFLSKRNKDTIITCLCRTVKENEVCEGSPNSKHLRIPVEAADIRIWNISTRILESLQAWLKAYFYPLVTWKLESDHFHVQINVGLIKYYGAR